jgi:hypothetical protein
MESTTSKVNNGNLIDQLLQRVSKGGQGSRDLGELGCCFCEQCGWINGLFAPGCHGKGPGRSWKWTGRGRPGTCSNPGGKRPAHELLELLGHRGTLSLP